MKLKTITTAILLLSTTVAFSAQAEMSKSAEETKVMSQKKNNEYEKMVIDKVWIITQALGFCRIKTVSTISLGFHRSSHNVTYPKSL